jgi:branched-chain amino acid aminotransferase
VLRLAADRGHRVERREISLAEWRDGAAAGDVVGAFACGTAAVIVPIGKLMAPGLEIVHAGPESSELALSLREELTGIQYGRVEDRYGWLTRLDD